MSPIEQKEESRSNADHVATIKEYQTKIESELSSICDGILKLLDLMLIPSATSGDSKVFYLRMKGYYHRYLAEFKTGAERKEAAENTLNAYKAPQGKETEQNRGGKKKNRAREEEQIRAEQRSGEEDEKKMRRKEDQHSKAKKRRRERVEQRHREKNPRRERREEQKQNSQRRRRGKKKVQEIEKSFKIVQN
ncbi:unnamed protein product [Camellia sinensis]